MLSKVQQKVKQLRQYHWYELNCVVNSKMAIQFDDYASEEKGANECQFVETVIIIIRTSHTNPHNPHITIC